MNAETPFGRQDLKRRIRNGALGLMAVALTFYFGFIFMLVHHSRH